MAWHGLTPDHSQYSLVSFALETLKGIEETLHLLLAYLVFATVALSIQVSFHVQKITFLAWWSCNIRRGMILVYTSEKMIQG